MVELMLPLVEGPGSELAVVEGCITPVSCKLKNPPSFRSNKSYQIIHKAEKQLLYECIRNINGSLAMLDKQREEQYTKFKDILSSHNHANTVQISVSDPEQDQALDLGLDRSRLFINRIKELQHEKIKTKQINKFERLYYKQYGCHHNLNRHNHRFDNTDHNSSSLSGQPNVPSSFSPRSSTASTTSSVPATPMDPTPSTSTMATHTKQGIPTSSNPNNTHTCTDHMDKWVINLSQTPLTNEQLSLLQKGPNFAITPKYPP